MKKFEEFFYCVTIFIFYKSFSKVLQSNFNFRLHSNYLISRNYNCLRFKIFWGGPNIFSFFCMIFNYSIWKIWCLFFSLFIKTCWGWFSTFLKYNLHWNVWSHLNIYIYISSMFVCPSVCLSVYYILCHIFANAYVLAKTKDNATKL